MLSSGGKGIFSQSGLGMSRLFRKKPSFYFSAEADVTRFGIGSDPARRMWRR
jgi:hypothetical protein